MYKDGIVLIDKKEGISSFLVCRKIRHITNIDKVGHTGTLDPFATGLMIVLLGKATKIAHLFNSLDKAYIGTIKMGKATDTYDRTGSVVNHKIPQVKIEELDNKINLFNKEYLQKPPLFSAIKKDGIRLYELARKKEKIEIESRSVTIYDFRRISEYKEDSFNFYAKVSKGTYIRSLVVDLAKSLDEYAFLDSLRRISIGSYDIKDAVTIEDFKEENIISLKEIFKNIRLLKLNEYMVKLVKNGVCLDERQIETDDPFIVVDDSNNFVAYYEPITKNRYKPVLQF